MSHPRADPAIAASPIVAAPLARRTQSVWIHRLLRVLAPTLIVVLASGHGLALWQGMGGSAGLSNGWPLWKDDHPLYFHSALITRAFLKDSFATAGYDPSFMSGYAKSVVFPASSTLPELVVAAFGGGRPELAYKVYVLISAAAYPWLIALACSLFGVRGWSAAIAVLLCLLYVWTDWPINYVTFGMLPYFLGIPIALVATGAFTRFLVRKDLLTWVASAALLSLAFLVHLTTAMVIAPAVLIAYGAAVKRQDESAPWSWRCHAAVWMMPAVVLALNAFWWFPGLFLSSTKGDSGFAFSHSDEGVLRRLGHIFWTEAPIETLLIVAGLPGLLLLIRRSGPTAAALCGFCAAGMAWGYLAGADPALDFLQPGRHTFALFSGLGIAGGLAIEEAIRRPWVRASRGDHLARWFAAGALLIGIRVVGPTLVESIRFHVLSGEPFLSSRPSPRLRWVLDRVKRHVKPGERLLYEEGGKDLPGVPDPYRRGRFSGLLPHLTGVELIGGPYLHAALTTNFTQFGEGKLFEKAGWDRDFFVRYARLYRPAAILCWSPHARSFCRKNPDLIRILDDDGSLIIARVNGFGGDAIRGRARVEAAPGRLRVRDIVPDLDGSVVLRYHFVPCLTTRSSVACEPELLEQDPVPFIRLRPAPGIQDVELRMSFPGRP
jgi:hypothetical protein